MNIPNINIGDTRELYRVAYQTWRLLERQVYDDETGQNINTIANYGAVIYQIAKRLEARQKTDLARVWWATQPSRNMDIYVWQNRERGNMFERGIRKHQSEIKRTSCGIEELTRGYRHCGRKHDGIIARKAYISSFDVYVCKTCADWLASKKKV